MEKVAKRTGCLIGHGAVCSAIKGRGRPATSRSVEKLIRVGTSDRADYSRRSFRAGRLRRHRRPRLPQAAAGLVPARPCRSEDRKSVVCGKSVSVRVDLGGRRIIKKKI